MSGGMPLAAWTIIARRRIRADRHGLHPVAGNSAALLRIGTDPVCSTPQEMAESIQRLAPVMPDAITLWGATVNGGRSRPPRSSSAVAMAHGVTMITGRPQAA